MPKRMHRKFRQNCFNKLEKSWKKALKSAPLVTIKSFTSWPNTVNFCPNWSKTLVLNVTRAWWSKQKSNKSDNANSFANRANLSPILWFFLTENWEYVNRKMTSLWKCSKPIKLKTIRLQLYQNLYNRKILMQSNQTNKPKTSKQSFRWIIFMTNWLLWAAYKLITSERRMPNSKENPLFHWLPDYFYPCRSLKNSSRSMRSIPTWTQVKSMALKQDANLKFIRTLALLFRNLPCWLLNSISLFTGSSILLELSLGLQYKKWRIFLHFLSFKIPSLPSAFCIWRSKREEEMILFISRAPHHKNCIFYSMVK